MTTDERATIRVTEELREWLSGRSEPPVVVGAALCWEMTAHLARHASDTEAALAAVDNLCLVMRDQIERLGVGADYP